MNNKTSWSPFESNLARLLQASLKPAESDMEERLTLAALNEVHPRMPVQKVSLFRRRSFYWTLPFAATAALIVVLFYGYAFYGTAEPAGSVRAVYGMVDLKAKDTSENIEQTLQPIMDQWTSIPANGQIQTRWGSQAEVRLADDTRLLSRPQTKLTIERGRAGERVIMDEGWISVEAARQMPGQSLQIQTPGTSISVLGTKFDVHVVQKASGRRQTRVSVASGTVSMESGGQTILLPPNTEGVAEEGQIPERRCQTPEINELLRLINLAGQLAREQNKAPGAASLIEFNADGTATVWLVTELNPNSPQEIPLNTTVREAAVYTMDGEPLAANLEQQGIYIRLAEAPPTDNADGTLILRLGGVKGLFIREGMGRFAFSLGEKNASVLSLCQIWLPQSADVEDITPKPIETACAITRQSFTLAVDALPPSLVKKETGR